MSKRLYIAILLLVTALSAGAQSWDLLFTAGMGTCGMNDLKDLNTQLMQQLPFESQVTDDFPMTFQFGGLATAVLVKEYRMGIKYVFSSTGSRIASSDYSGTYYFDDVVNGNTIGLVNRILLADVNPVKINIQVNLGMVASSIRMKEYLQVYDTSSTSTARYHALGGFAELQLEAAFQWKMLETGVFIGYFYNPGGKIMTSDNQDTGSHTSWTGFRFGIEVGIAGKKRSPAKP